MARKPKQYEDDDGRVIADMSGVSRPALFHPGTPSDSRSPLQQDREEEEKPQRPWEDSGMSREDRRAYMWAALKSALVLGSVYIVVLGLLIVLLVLLWR